MQNNKNKMKQGFTLVELMVVAVIVAILAAVAIPLMTAQVSRAIATEAESGIGTGKSNLRAILAQSGRYDEDPDGNTIASGSNLIDIPGFAPGDLTGTYFNDEDYVLTEVTSNSFVITVTPNAAGTAPQSAKAADRINSVEYSSDAGTFVRDLK